MSDAPLFTSECKEKGGVVVREVRQTYLSITKLRHFHERMRGFSTIFNVENSFEAFLRVFITPGEDGRLYSSALVWEVDDVGILYLSEIRPGYDALAHFFFWDGRLRGRGYLIRDAVEYAIKTFEFHRITVELPLWMKPVVFRTVEEVGFVKEGRRRASSFYKDQWFDANVYSLLDSEVVWDQK